MGSLFSSAAAAAAAGEYGVRRRRPRRLIKEERDADLALEHAYSALEHYISNNPGAEFYPVDPMKTKAACVGFRHDFWYHVGFVARRRDAAATEHRFFTELRYDRNSYCLIVETCTILEEPLCRFRSRCAFCPDKFEILHPGDAEFICGKKGHRKKFFRQRDILSIPFRVGGYDYLRHLRRAKSRGLL